MTPEEKRVCVKHDGGKQRQATRRRGEDRYVRGKLREEKQKRQSLAHEGSWGLDECVWKKRKVNEDSLG